MQELQENMPYMVLVWDINAYTSLVFSVNSTAWSTKTYLRLCQWPGTCPMASIMGLAGVKPDAGTTASAPSTASVPAGSSFMKGKSLVSGWHKDGPKQLATRCFFFVKVMIYDENVLKPIRCICSHGGMKERRFFVFLEKIIRNRMIVPMSIVATQLLWCIQTLKMMASE